MPKNIPGTSKAMATAIIISATFMALSLYPMPLKKALADELSDAKAAVDLSQMNILSSCDTIRTLLGDHPPDPDREGLLTHCDSSMSSIKSYCDTHQDLSLKTCLDERLGQYLSARSALNATG